MTPFPHKKKVLGYLCWPLLLMAALCILTSLYSTPSIIFSIIGIVVLVSLALYQMPRCSLGALSPFPVFILGGALYILPTALTIIASGAFVTERQIPTGVLTQSVAIASAALLCATSGYLAFLSCTVPRIQLLWHRPLWRQGRMIAAIGLVLIVIGMSAAAHFVFNVAGFDVLRSATYGGRYVLMDGHGLLIGCISWISLGGLIYYAYFLHRGKHFASLGGLLLAAVALGWWTFIIGSRSPLLYFLIAVVVVRQISWKPVRLLVLAALGLILIAAAIAFELSGRTFSLDAISSSQKDPTSLMNPANSELGAPIQTLADIIHAVPNIEPYQFGRTYFEIPAVLVPKKIWPDRPQGAGNWYASRFYPSYWEAGGGYAFSPVAEAYLNFGPVGVVIIFAGIGVLLGALERRLVYYCGISIWITIAYAVAVPYILMFSRLDAATFVKSLCIVTLGPLLVSAAVGKLLREILRPPNLDSFKNKVLGNPAVADQHQVVKLDTQH